MVVTTNAVDPEYKAYWKNLGFSLPHLIAAGPFDPQYSLSELILNKKDIQKEILAFVRNADARLEFFLLAQTEAELAHALNIAPYCNFDLSLELSGKIAFKYLCEKLDLPTLPWITSDDMDRLFEEGKKSLAEGDSFLLKADDGTGGVECGGVLRVESMEALHHAMESIAHVNVRFLKEPFLGNKSYEGSLHWEITENAELNVLGFFETLEIDCSYAGVSHPSDIPSSIIDGINSQLRKKLAPWLIQKNGRGYYSCDFLIDDQGRWFWSDFNPRKGATLYLRDMVRRLSKIHYNQLDCPFWYEHYLRIPQEFGASPSFSSIAEKISSYLIPESPPFIVIINPGIVRHGFLDMAGISIKSKTEARQIVQEVKQRLNIHAYGVQ